MTPAIVIVTYNRPRLLERLLSAIFNAKYIDADITLIISIDYQASAAHEEVVKIANRFQWKYGKKEVLIRERNLGLQNHVLTCGDLTNQYQSIIMLEDDISVSPFFYAYAQKALSFYKEDPKIGDISLYNHRRNFCNNLPFEVLGERSSDVYFLQIAASWGQAWIF